jgi:hypothetical protein
MKKTETDKKKQRRGEGRRREGEFQNPSQKPAASLVHNASGR